MSQATPGADPKPLSIDALVRVCSYYRDAELRGSNLLYRMLRIVDDPESQMNLS
jgi:hypothetical protein